MENKKFKNMSSEEKNLKMTDINWGLYYYFCRVNNISSSRANSLTKFKTFKEDMNLL